MSWNRIVWAGVVAVGMTAGAWATPSCTSTTDETGGGAVLKASVTAGACFKIDNVVYGNFNVAALPSATVLIFNSNVIGGIDHVQLSFGGNWHSGTTYNWSYELAIATGAPLGTVFTSLDADFDQTAGGPSVLDKVSTPPGDALIHMVKNATSVLPGSNSVSNFGPDLTAFAIAERLSVNGSVANVTNTVSVFSPQPQPPIPEPATLALLGAGLISLRLRRRKS